ncbi:hypothetical protein B0H11DRAFT_2005908 [Mycena galericulata]|nr:hypothetical protein B0H11DRAFT_2005908 [Mycena galericulata]
MNFRFLLVYILTSDAGQESLDEWVLKDESITLALAELTAKRLATERAYSFFRPVDLCIDPLDNIGTRVKDYLLAPPRQDELARFQRVNSIWPSGSSASSSDPQKVDLIVVDEEKISLLQSLSNPTLAPRLATVLVRRHTHAKLLKLPSPSAVANDPFVIATDDDSSLYIGRPAGRFGPPVALFDPILASLADTMDHPESIDVTPDILGLAHQFFLASIRPYKTKRERGIALRAILEQLFPGGDWQSVLSGGIAKPEACWLLAMIYELKKERGCFGDPQVQCTVDYAKMITDAKLMSFRECSNCPSILLSQAGGQIDISIAVTTDVIYAEGQVLALARAFQATRVAFSSLRSFYKDLEVAHIPNGQHMSGTTHPAQRDLDRQHAIYRALAQGTHPSIPAGDVVVKFTRRYNARAHRILAEAGLAPALHYTSDVLGGYTIVVMELIRGKTMWEWIQTEVDRTAPIRSVLADVTKAVELLHAQGIVFGDLRAPNVMVRADERGVLVDFDWPAEAGVGRYPSTLFKESGEWAPGVERYGIMQLEHDLFMLEQLREVVQVSQWQGNT